MSLDSNIKIIIKKHRITILTFARLSKIFKLSKKCLNSSIHKAPPAVASLPRALLFMSSWKYIYNNISVDRARPRKIISPFPEDCRCIIFHDRYLWWDFYYKFVRCLYTFFIAIELFDGSQIILWQTRYDLLWDRFTIKCFLNFDMS